jgi:endonuclease III
MQLIPKRKWIGFSHQMIHHGRKTCKARKPLCHLCTIEKVCRSKDKVLAFPLANIERQGRRGRTGQ